MSEFKQLTKNFNEEEFACHCCNNVIVDMKLVNALQELRDMLNKPIILNCGYRCLKHNIEVGSENTSQHVKGKAADIRVEGMTPRELAREAEKIKMFKYGGIGIYERKNFVHVDVRLIPSRWVG